MKQLYTLTMFLAATCYSALAQNFETVTKEIEVFETVEENKRDMSIGVIGGPIKYLGEYASETTIGYGVLIEKHYTPQFNIQFNFYKGSISYTDTSDLIQSTNYLGLDVMGSLNLVELFAKKDKVNRVSPYLSLGIGVVNSQASHYVGKGQIDFNIPMALGTNFFLNDKFSVGVDVNARYLFSDNFDNSLTTSISDLVVTPGITLKYLIGQKKVTNRVSVMKSITYNKPIEEKVSYEKYIDPTENISYEPFVEVSVKDKIPENTNEGELSSSKWTSGDENISNSSEENKNSNIKNNEAYVEKDYFENQSTTTKEIMKDKHLFYTIQVGSYKDADYDFSRKIGFRPDYVFYNNELKLYNYLYGMYSNKEDALVDLNRVRNKVRGAFVVAIYNGVRLTNREAEKTIENNPSVVNLEESKKNLK